MILAVEGQVGAGKTTLTRLLGAWSRIEPEYPPAPQAGDGDDHWAVQRHYLACERERRLRLAADPGGWLVLDRSVVSQAAHVHAVAELGLADSRAALATYLAEHRDEVVDPCWFVHLDPPGEVRRAQLARREAGEGRLGTVALLQDLAYEAAVDRFVRAFLARVGRTVRLAGFDPEDTAWARRLLESLDRRPGAPSDTVAVLIDLLTGRLDGDGR